MTASWRTNKACLCSDFQLLHSRAELGNKVANSARACAKTNCVCAAICRLLFAAASNANCATPKLLSGEHCKRRASLEEFISAIRILLREFACNKKRVCASCCGGLLCGRGLIKPNCRGERKRSCASELNRASFANQSREFSARSSRRQVIRFVVRSCRASMKNVAISYVMKKDDINVEAPLAELASSPERRETKNASFAIRRQFCRRCCVRCLPSANNKLALHQTSAKRTEKA